MSGEIRPSSTTGYEGLNQPKVTWNPVIDDKHQQQHQTIESLRISDDERSEKINPTKEVDSEATPGPVSLDIDFEQIKDIEHLKEALSPEVISYLVNKIASDNEVDVQEELLKAGPMLEEA